jgi:hypothetical protein
MGTFSPPSLTKKGRIAPLVLARSQRLLSPKSGVHGKSTCALHRPRDAKPHHVFRGKLEKKNHHGSAKDHHLRDRLFEELQMRASPGRENRGMERLAIVALSIPIVVKVDDFERLLYECPYAT